MPFQEEDDHDLDEESGLDGEEASSECSSYSEQEDMESSCSSNITSHKNSHQQEFGSSIANKESFKVLTTAELIDMMQALGEELSAVVWCSPAECVSLLRHSDWNREKLLEKVFDSEKTSSSCISTFQPNRGNQCCEICFEEDNGKQLRALACQHYFCEDCWREHISSKISIGHLKSLLCPADKCSQIVGDQLITELLQTQPSVTQLYQRLIVNQFVECTKSLKWCPWQDCSLAIQLESRPFTDQPPKVKCSCGFTFCFGCSKEWHRPVMCALLHMWLVRCEDDSETFNWINANTKDCPKCKAPIEKNGGCNRIVCGKSSCHYQFCWSCLKDWNVHGYTASCNKFDEEEAKKASSSRVSLQRYLHYYNRFTNHKASLKLEAKLFEEVESKMLLMQKTNFSYVETQFLRHAVFVLNECRRTLMYTYALGFYLLPSNSKQLFEDNQQDLEVATERLSELLERDLDEQGQEEKVDLSELSQRVKDKASYVHKRRLVLEEQCLESVFVFDKTLTKGIQF